MLHNWNNMGHVIVCFSRWEEYGETSLTLESLQGIPAENVTSPASLSQTGVPHRQVLISTGTWVPKHRVGDCSSAPSVPVTTCCQGAGDVAGTAGVPDLPPRTRAWAEAAAWAAAAWADTGASTTIVSTVNPDNPRTTPQDSPTTLTLDEAPWDNRRGSAGEGHIQVFEGSRAGIREHRIAEQTYSLPVAPCGHLCQAAGQDAGGVGDLASWAAPAAGAVICPAVVCTGDINHPMASTE